jgi:hypothetical protein
MRRENLCLAAAQYSDPEKLIRERIKLNFQLSTDQTFNFQQTLSTFNIPQVQLSTDLKFILRIAGKSFL